jgi:hypothetical protein
MRKEFADGVPIFKYQNKRSKMIIQLFELKELVDF